MIAFQLLRMRARDSRLHSSSVTGPESAAAGWLPRSRRQRGAALVEMTLVLPFLVTLAFGLLETGMGWRNAITVTSAARQGARVTSHLGTDARSDQEGVLAVQAVMGSEINMVDFIVIYKANAGGEVPPACTAGPTGTSVPDLCNAYGPDEISHANDDAFWGCVGGYDTAWCPTTMRVNDARTADHVGVYIQFDHEYFTGIIPGDPPDIKRHTVMRIEPEVN